MTAPAVTLVRDRRFVHLFLVALIAGCGGAAASDEASLDGLPAFELVEEVRIGSVDDPEIGFSAPGPIDLDADGNVYVVEMQDTEIRVFDQAGTPQRVIGRPGEGPGEFMNVPSIWLLGDTLWALESGSASRVSLFTREGEHVWTSRAFDGLHIAMHGGGMDGVIRPRNLAPDGTFIGDMTSFTSRRDPTLDAPEANDTLVIPRADDGSLDRGFVVLGPDLTLLGEVTVPRNARVAWMTVDTVWAIERDDFDIPWVVRYSVSRAD